MKSYLFLFTIGPVQSFIAQARKTQDLYAGSQLLSKLVQIGINEFHKEITAQGYKVNLIFPKNWEENKVSLPNRFIGKISNESAIDFNAITTIGNHVKKQVKENFKGIAKDALKGLYTPSVETQLKRHLDVHWVALPIEKNYKETYTKLESLAGSVKNIRVFEQLGNGTGEIGRKCNIDGENNALFHHGQPSQIWLNKQSKQLNDFILNPGEAISAVSYLKRKYLKEQFPSVAEVALKKAIDTLKDTEAEKCLTDYKQLCGSKNGFISYCIKKGERIQFNLNDVDKINDNFDYQLIFPENITAKNFPLEEQRNYAVQIAERLSSKLKDKHYALIMFDGDKMGEWLSGQHTEHNESELEEFHSGLSRSLAEFAKKVPSILNKQKGRVIYTGGDDFLGMVNLHYLFDVLIELRESFHQIINAQIHRKKEGKEFTFSAGIVISHYKIPLSEVLNKVREMEKKAKKEGDRNAFALAVLKHSGEIQETIFKWDADSNSPNSCSNLKAIQVVFDNLNQNIYSNKFITSLTTELYQLAGLELTAITSLNLNSIKVEINRLVQKAIIDKERGKANLSKISTALSDLVGNKQDKQIQNFIHALHIADFMQRRIQKFNNDEN